MNDVELHWCAHFLRKTSSFFGDLDEHPGFLEQGTQIAMISSLLTRFWSTLCGFCASPPKRPRTSGDILLLRWARTSHTYTNAVQFVSVLGPFCCAVSGIGPCTNGTQRFGRVCALPACHFFAKIRITRGLNFFKNRSFFSPFFETSKTRVLVVFILRHGRF